MMTTDIEQYIFDISQQLSIKANGVNGNELELITLIRNCQFLYDKSRPDFKDNELKEATWEAIAKVLQASVSDCKHRWRSLREQYNKLKKHSDDKSVAWEYYENMKFIEPYIIPRKSFVYKKDKMEDDLDISIKEEWLESSNDDFGSDVDIKERIFKLIECVQAHPTLYNNTDIKNKPKKVVLWSQIAQQVGLSPTECESRWKNLREKFGRERKQKKENDEKHWTFYNALSFLDKHVRERRVYKTFTPYKKLLPKSTQISMETHRVEPSVLVTPTIIDTTNVSLNNIEFIEAPFAENIEQNITLCLSPEDNTLDHSIHDVEIKDKDNETEFRIEEADSHCKEPDEDDLFGQTIAAELKRISNNRKKKKIKSEIFKLLYEAESD